MINELLAGLFGGASQGLGQIQDERRRQQQLQLQQRSQEMQMQEQKRNAIMEAYKTLQPGQQIEPESASQFKALGLGGLEAQGDKIIKAKSPQDQLIDFKLSEAEEDAKVRLRKHALMDLVHNAGSDFFLQPPQQRQAAFLAAGETSDEWMTPEEKVRFSPQVASAGITASARYATAGAGRNPYAGQNAAVGLEKAARDAADTAAKHPITGQIDKQVWQSTYNEFKSTIARGGGQQAAPAAGRGRIISIKPLP